MSRLGGSVQPQPLPSLAGCAAPPGAPNATPPANDFAGVDPAVMAMAGPLLTGNSVADRNIVRFYEARAQLLRRQQQV